MATTQGRSFLGGRRRVVGSWFSWFFWFLVLGSWFLVVWCTGRVHCKLQNANCKMQMAVDWEIDSAAEHCVLRGDPKRSGNRQFALNSHFAICNLQFAFCILQRAQPTLLATRDPSADLIAQGSGLVGSFRLRASQQVTGGLLIVAQQEIGARRAGVIPGAAAPGFDLC